MIIPLRSPTQIRCDVCKCVCVLISLMSPWQVVVLCDHKVQIRDPYRVSVCLELRLDRCDGVHSLIKSMTKSFFTDEKQDTK